MSTQPQTERCDRCGRYMPVVQISPWEFTYRCQPPCTSKGVISFSHANEPPVFQGQQPTDQPTQIGLIFEATR